MPASRALPQMLREFGTRVHQMFLSGKRAVTNFLRILRDGVANWRREREIMLRVLRVKTLDEPECVRHHEHLSIALQAGSNSNRRYTYVRRDVGREFCRHFFKNHSVHTRLRESDGVIDDHISRIRTLSLRDKTANLIHGLRTQSNVPH